MRKPPLIIIGNTRSILRLGPASMKNLAAWTQTDSDIIAHFLQVEAQIAKSRWRRAKLSLTTQGGKLLASDFPEFEDFVYAAVYFRQLILKGDDLLNKAVDRYIGFLDCPMRRFWIAAEQRGFNAELNGKAFHLNAYTVRELFDAFAYGARLIHHAPDPKKEDGRRFLAIFDNEPRERVLLALNGSLRHLLNHIARAAAVIYQDFAHWLEQYGLPRPDIRWHDRLFTISK